MTISRKAFCWSLAGATVTLWLQGCGGGDGYSDSGSGGGTSSNCGASGGAISANHGHALTIARADLDSTSARSYNLSPSVEGHVHSLTLSPTQFATLKGGGSVIVTSSVTTASALYNGTHSHEVTIVVAAGCP